MSNRIVVTLLALLFASVSCGSGEWEEFFPTFTPQPSNDEPTIAPTSTAGEVIVSTVVPSGTLPATIHPDPTPTAICPDGSGCFFPELLATPLGDSLWEYTILRYYKVQCTAMDGDDPSSCNVRSRPLLDGDTFIRTVPFGQTLDVSALYHCEVYSYCDVEVVEWYFTVGKEWLAATDDVWQNITPGK